MSAATYLVFGGCHGGVRRATPTTWSTCSSAANASSRDVPTFPVAPVTTTLMSSPPGGVPRSEKRNQKRFRKKRSVEAVCTGSRVHANSRGQCDLPRPVGRPRGRRRGRRSRRGGTVQQTQARQAAGAVFGVGVARAVDALVSRRRRAAARGSRRRGLLLRPGTCKAGRGDGASRPVGPPPH